jgi:hypothetical protein
LKVFFHPHFKMLLRVADVDLVRHLTGNPVDDDRHSAITSVQCMDKKIKGVRALLRCLPFVTFHEV